MRIGLLFALAVPVLGVSGAVARGDMRDVSGRLAPAPMAQDTGAAVAPPSAAALDFVAAGQTAWDVPQNPVFAGPAVSIPEVQDQSVKTTALEALRQRSLEALWPGSLDDHPGGDLDDAEGRDVAPIHDASRPVRQPRAVVTAKDPATQLDVSVQPPARRSFKMPWQTGIFQ